MKKINSIHYGATVILIGLLFLVPIPCILYGVNAWLHIDVLSCFGITSIIIGSLIEIVFLLYLMLESRQDGKIDRYCQTHKGTRIPLRDGRYECCNCGNRNLSQKDTECSICGMKFESEPYMSAQNILKK